MAQQQAAVNPRFSPKALAFLRALKRNNDRDWFKARKDQYERCCAAPMIEMIERLAVDFRSFAPDLRRQPEGVALPHLPRHAVLGEQGAAQDARRRRLSLPRPREASGRRPLLRGRAGWVWVGGGMYCAGHVTAAGRARAHRGQPPAVARDRRIAGVSAQASAARRDERLQRVPRGFPTDHEAAEYLKYRQFLAGREFPAAFATSPRFYAGVLGVFRQVAPLTGSSTSRFVG